MKTILIILDGLGDRPHPALNNKTPLEDADTPNLDLLAKKGVTGLMQTTKSDKVQSDVTINILGHPTLIKRGILEAMGANINVQHGDLCVRTNFATKKNNIIIDRRAGRTLTDKEATLLAQTLNKKVKLPFPFIFKSTVQHRGVLVIRGGFSDNITDADPMYGTKGLSQPLDDEETTKISANVINNFIQQANHILSTHPINKRREKRGKLPANTITARSAATELPKIDKKPGWKAVVTMPLEKGIAKAFGMRRFKVKVPKLDNYDVYKNLYAELTAQSRIARKAIHQNTNLYIHFKPTDLPGHDGLPHEKKRMIELLDEEFFSHVTKLNDKLVCVTADHATPCILKSHAKDPVPILITGNGTDQVSLFSEKACKSGSLGIINAKKLMHILNRML